MQDYLPKTAPYKHQVEALRLVTSRDAFGLFMDMRTGKSKVVLDDAARGYCNGRFDALLVIAPNGVHRNWIENEVPAHLPDYVPRRTAFWSASPRKAERAALEKIMQPAGDTPLRILAMNYEAASTPRGYKFAEQFLRVTNAMLAADESHRIKTPSAACTKALIKLGKLAVARRILTGTPATESPLDVYSQFKFLGEDLLGYGSYYAFRNRYAVLRRRAFPGRKMFDEVVGYQNIEELQQLIAPHSYRVRIEDCADMPAKVYTRRYVELSERQRKLYNVLRTKLKAELDGATISAPLALTRLLRLQQIIGGFAAVSSQAVGAATNIEALFAAPDAAIPVKIDDRCPRVTALLEALEEISGKVIVWARFRPELAALRDAVAKEYGARSVVEYHGGVNNADRAANVAAFQDRDSPVRFFVGQPHSGGVGLTLDAADALIYYSNDFSLTTRLQSEERATSLNKKTPVAVIDLEAPDTVDGKVIAALRSKRDLAATVTGDELRAWL